jgi:hypothetical protein
MAPDDEVELFKYTKND